MGGTYREFYERSPCGTVRGTHVDVEDKDFVIFMAQSIVTGRYDRTVFESFGLVIIDEAHHWAAPTLSKTMGYFPARCLLALTATPDRKDGLGYVLSWYFGGTVALVKRKAQTGVTVQVIRLTSGRAKEVRLRNGKTCLPRTISMMIKDEARNKIIAQRVWKMRQEDDRQIIVLSDRRKHLETLRTVLHDMGAPEDQIGMFTGETTKKGVARREAERTRPILLATVRMAEEGFDEPRLDTLVFATPKSNITQCVGRIQRSHPEKKNPLIVDYYDTYCGGSIHGMARARKRFYEDCKFKLVHA